MNDLKKCYSIGDKVQIDYTNAVGEVQEFVSQIVDIHEAGYIDILIPIYKRMNVHIRNGSFLKLVAMKGDATYEVRTVLQDKLFGSIPLLRLKVISEVKKIQRRGYFRLKVFKEIEARSVIDLEEEKYGESFKCNLQDISVGGLMFSSREYFNENDTLEFTLNLNGTTKVVLGVIVRRILNDSYRAPYSYGVKFKDINMTDRNAISKFIFEEQRRLIKKGLI